MNNDIDESRIQEAWRDECKTLRRATPNKDRSIFSIYEAGWQARTSDAERLNEECERLRGLLAEAADCIEAWGAYASGYFQEKHDLAGDVRRFHEAAESKQEQ